MNINTGVGVFMLKHIGLSVKNNEDLEKFYFDILGFKTEHKFVINSDYSKRLFNIDDNAQIYLIKKDDLLLEIFIKNLPANRNYSHICIEMENRDKILEKVKENNYTYTIIEREKENLVFISDNSGNLFEIKEK